MRVLRVNEGPEAPESDEVFLRILSETVLSPLGSLVGDLSLGSSVIGFSLWSSVIGSSLIGSSSGSSVIASSFSDMVFPVCIFY